MGKSVRYKHLQQEPSVDSRPEPDPDIPPIPLLYKSFGHFLDIMDAHDNVPRLSDIDIWEHMLDCTNFSFCSGRCNSGVSAHLGK
jgi:hypothetical protein